MIMGDQWIGSKLFKNGINLKSTIVMMIPKENDPKEATIRRQKNSKIRIERLSINCLLIVNYS